MRGVFWALVILALAVSGAGVGLGDIAKADPTNLVGGVMIAHHPAAMVYSSDPPPEGWCANYLNNHRITAADQQVNRIDTQGAPVFWFVISAWAEDKEFCGAEFGIGNYDPLAFVISETGPCGTDTEPLEIPNGAWPGPNTGVALARQGAAWSGNYIPIYWFAGYAYYATTMQLTTNPAEPPLQPFAGWANCATPPVAASAECLGAMGILQDGVRCDPPTGPLPGACCFGGATCQLVLQDDCDAAGGVWDGSPTCTEPNPCPNTAACCKHDDLTGVETCEMLIQQDCANQGGVWHSGQDCATFTCPTLRACCVDQLCLLTTQTDCATTYQGTWMQDEFSCTTPANPCLWIRACCLSQEDCQLMTQDECTTAGGQWLESQQACAPGGGCPIPADVTTWGSIKAIYR